MKLVINASPIIFLVKLGLIHHIPNLFEELIIPFGVQNEILRKKDEVQKWVSEKGKIYIIKVEDITSYITAWDLGQGETEVIAFAKYSKDCIAALDDKSARNCAYSLGIPVIGTIGLILLMGKRKMLNNVEYYLKRLRSLGYRINDDLFHYAIELSGNNDSSPEEGG